MNANMTFPAENKHSKLTLDTKKWYILDIEHLCETATYNYLSLGTIYYTQLYMFSNLMNFFIT